MMAGRQITKWGSKGGCVARVHREKYRRGEEYSEGAPEICRGPPLSTDGAHRHKETAQI